MSLSLRLQTEGGRFESSPSWTHRLELPIEVSLTRNQRQVRFRSPLAPFLDAEGKLMIVAPGESGVELCRRTAESFEVVGRLAGFDLAAGIVPRPFSPLVRDLDGNGVPDISCICETAKAAHALVFLRP